jgi:hypothetical protein
VLVRRLLPYAVLLAEVLVFYRHALFREGYVIPWDLRYFHLTHASFIAESLKRGELPLWDPFTYCGRPFAANIQTEVFYPPLVMAVLASNLTGGAHLLNFLEWEVVLHVFLAGVFAFWLLRRLGSGTPAALLGASIYQLGGFFASQAQHMGAVNAAAWLPLAWLAVLSLGGKAHWRWLAVLAASMAMAVLAGLPAVSVVVIGSSILLAVALVACGTRPLRLLLSVLVACLWAVLLAAVQLLPTVELSRLSIAQYRADWLGSGGGLPLASLVSLVAPNYYGIFDLHRYSGPWNPTFLYLYCSLGGLALALAAVSFCKKPEVRAFTLLVPVTALWMLGDSTPVWRLFYPLLPAAIRNALHPEFAMPAFILSLAVLAGLGAAEFLKRPALAWVAVCVVLVDLTWAGSGRPMNTARLQDEPGVTRESFEGSRELLARVRDLVSRSFPPARIDTAGASINWPMTAAMIEVPTANGNDPLALARTIQARLAFADGERWGAYYEVSRLESPVLDLLNVRYVLTRAPLDPAQLSRSGLIHVATLPGNEVYEDPEVLPRFFLVDRVRRAAGMEEAAAMLKSGAFDPRSEAVVEGAVEVSGGSGSVRVLAYARRRVLLEIDAAAPGFLVTSETHYPGWRAFLDGREAPIYYTNVAFRGLPVPAGRHRVEFEFAPAILAWSALLSAGALLPFCLLPLAFCLARRRRPASRSFPLPSLRRK